MFNRGSNHNNERSFNLANFSNRDGLRRHAQMLEEKIFTEGADYRMICQATKPLTETENALTEVNKDES